MTSQQRDHAVSVTIKHEGLSVPLFVVVVVVLSHLACVSLLAVAMVCEIAACLSIHSSFCLSISPYQESLLFSLFFSQSVSWLVSPYITLASITTFNSRVFSNKAFVLSQCTLQDSVACTHLKFSIFCRAFDVMGIVDVILISTWKGLLSFCSNCTEWERGKKNMDMTNVVWRTWATTSFCSSIL